MVSNISSYASLYSSAVQKSYPVVATATSTTSPQTNSAGSGAAVTSSSSSATAGMSIAQIRNITDQMAVSGKLTIKQQMALIGGGLMDPNPADPGYQPTSTLQVGYSRSDGGSYDFTGMMQSAAAAAAAAGLNETADIYRSIDQSFQDYVSSSHVDLLA